MRSPKLKIEARTLLLFLAFLPFLIKSGNSTQCHLLALSGGGTKGAWEAGAFKAMTDLLYSDEIRYEVITGVSAGALNGFFISMYPPGSEHEASEKLVSIWKSIKQDDIFTMWPLGPIEGFLSKPSFVNNTRHYAYVAKKFKELGGKLAREYTMALVDLQQGKYLSFDESLPREKVPVYVVGSSAIPGLFKYVVDNDEVLVDGGTTNNLNLLRGVEKCRKKVKKDSEIVADIILAKPQYPGNYSLSKHKSYDLYYREKELSEMMQVYFVLYDTIRALPNISWRYIIAQRENPPGFMGYTMSFDPKVLKEMINMGYKRAKEVIEKKQLSQSEENQMIEDNIDLVLESIAAPHLKGRIGDRILIR